MLLSAGVVSRSTCQTYLSGRSCLEWSGSLFLS